MFCHFSFAGEDCDVEMRVRRNTVYEASRGEVLKITCQVGFCNNSPPTISWYKLEKTAGRVPVNVSSSSHIKTEWESLNHSEGILFLIFQNILTNDSGVYQCGSYTHSGVALSHVINIYVHGE